MAKLNQIIAVEKGAKSRAASSLSELARVLPREDLFYGFSKSYEKLDEDTEDLPGEKKRVQLTYQDALNHIKSALSEVMDVTAKKDVGNTVALADVKVGDRLALEGLPVTYLLALEKNLESIKTLVSSLPELDPSEDWSLDPSSGMYKTPSLKTHRTKKVAKPIVMYDATAEHPAQTQLISEDILAGYWNTIKQSGAIPKPIKEMLMGRILALSDAVKMAREEANSREVTYSQSVSERVFDFLFTDIEAS